MDRHGLHYQATSERIFCMRIRLLSTFLLIALLLGCTKTQQGYKVRHEVWEPVVFAPQYYASCVIDDQSPFVDIPAKATLIVTALPGCLVGFPLFLLSTPLERGGGETTIGEDLTFFLYVPLLASGIVATPFRILQEVFWDFPRWVVSREEGQTPSGAKGKPPHAPESKELGLQDQESSDEGEPSVSDGAKEE
jgi:hypothetical protein